MLLDGYINIHYLNIALNCVSRPPIPILLKSQSGLMICARSTFPLLFPVKFMLLPSIFSNVIGVLANSKPHVTWMKRKFVIINHGAYMSPVAANYRFVVVYLGNSFSRVKKMNQNYLGSFVEDFVWLITMLHFNCLFLFLKPLTLLATNPK